MSGDRALQADLPFCLCAPYHIQLYKVTSGSAEDSTFVEWSANFSSDAGQSRALLSLTPVSPDLPMLETYLILRLPRPVISQTPV